MALMKKLLYMNYYNLKVLLTYKTDFLISLFSSICNLILMILSIYIIFEQTPTLIGWNRREILFLFGFQQISISLYLMLWSGIQSLPRLIIDGRFQFFLTKPIHSLIFIINSGYSLAGLMQLIFGVIIIFYSKVMILTSGTIVLLLILVISSNIINLSFQIIMSSFCFWIGPSMGLFWYIYGLLEINKYPLDIYDSLIRNFLIIIPFAFTAYFPVSLLLNKSNGIFGYLTPIVSAITFIVSVFFWNRGVRRFESTGN